MNDLFGEPRTKASSSGKSPSTEHGPPEIKTGGACLHDLRGAGSLRLRREASGRPHGRWACSAHRDAVKQSHRK